MLERMPAWLRGLLALIVGVVVAGVSTPVAQASNAIAGVLIPWGLVLALIVVVAYLLGLRLVFATRWPAILGAVGIVATVFLLSLEGPGGGILMPANLAGTVWAIAPTLIAVVIVALPRLGRSVDLSSSTRS